MAAVSPVMQTSARAPLHCLERICELEDELWSSEERRFRGCLENELAQKDGGLKTVCHGDTEGVQRPSRQLHVLWRSRIQKNDTILLRPSLDSMQPPPSDEEEFGSVTLEKLHDPLEEEQLLHPNGMYLPENSWSILLEFLPVAEVVNKETRAVSRFFSNSKIWLAHLLKLMDFDSLPQHTGKKPLGVEQIQKPACSSWRTHPASEFSSWSFALGHGKADRASELERGASEGYRMFLNGLFMWNAQYPQMVQPFLTTVMQWYFSGQGGLSSVGNNLCYWMVGEVPSVRRPILVDLLSLTRTKGLSPDKYEFYIDLLRGCSSVFQHLGRDSVAELLVSVRSWTDQSLRTRCLEAIIAILNNVVLTDESDAVLANRCFRHIFYFEAQGKPDKAAAQIQKVLDLLKQSS
eukprot:Skav229889  [mRNA]  locus=scaffold247:506101:509746:- [translate_table: standard]